eukprot:4527245-Amphidinium_carterae.1
MQSAVRHCVYALGSSAATKGSHGRAFDKRIEHKTNVMNQTKSARHKDRIAATEFSRLLCLHAQMLTSGADVTCSKPSDCAIMGTTLCLIEQ